MRKDRRLELNIPPPIHHQVTVCTVHSTAVTTTAAAAQGRFSSRPSTSLSLSLWKPFPLAAWNMANTQSDRPCTLRQGSDRCAKVQCKRPVALQPSADATMHRWPLVPRLRPRIHGEAGEATPEAALLPPGRPGQSGSAGHGRRYCVSYVCSQVVDTVLYSRYRFACICILSPYTCIERRLFLPLLPSIIHAEPAFLHEPPHLSPPSAAMMIGEVSSRYV